MVAPSLDSYSAKMQMRYMVQRARPLSYSRGPGLIQQSNSREENSIFAEGVGRVIIGILLAVLGIILLSLSMAVFATNTAAVDAVDFNFDPIHWIIWTSSVTIISGVCGVASRKLKVLVSVFLAMSLLSMLNCIGGCVWTALASYKIYLYLQHHDSPIVTDHMYLYMFMCITFSIQIMTSLLGAVCTWSTLRKSRSSGQHTQIETVFAQSTEEVSTSSIDSPNFSNVTSSHSPGF